MIRVGCQVLPQHGDYAQQRDAWVRAEQLGADTIFNWDHFFPLSGPRDGKHLECWTLLAAMAEATQRAEIGALVTANSYRNPNLLADMARTVDHISGGRLILGIGAGWFERDYDEYGYEFGTAPDRVRHLRDSLPVIEARWKKLNPPPTRRIPILIGGGGEKVTLRLTARHADIWHGFGDVRTMRHKLSVLRGWCDDVGRHFGEIELSTSLSRNNLDSADEYMQLGFSHFIVSADGPDYDLGLLGEVLAWRDAHLAAA
jgi:probable F420-dependent oxidoreductase